MLAADQPLRMTARQSLVRSGRNINGSLYTNLVRRLQLRRQQFKAAQRGVDFVFLRIEICPAMMALGKDSNAIYVSNLQGLLELLLVKLCTNLRNMLRGMKIQMYLSESHGRIILSFICIPQMVIVNRLPYSTRLCKSYCEKKHGFFPKKPRLDLERSH